MDALTFLMEFAVIAAHSCGRGVGVKGLVEETGLSRQAIHRHLSRLRKQNLICKIKHGVYTIEASSPMVAIGLICVTPIDLAQYNYECRKES